MAVGIDGDLNTMVPHLFLDVGQGFAVLDEQAGEGVAQVVNSYIPQSRLCQELMPDAIVEIRLVEGPSFLIRKHPLRHFTPALSQRLLLPFYKQDLERLCQLQGHIHSSALAALWCGQV